MADIFGTHQLIDYLAQTGLKLAHVNHEKAIIELIFHGTHGQWRMIVGIQQEGDARKLMLIVPHIGSITTKKRQECLEALMAVNYRIAMGKFGLDLDDGEVRLEESIPLAQHAITFEQFRLALNALMQTVAMYQSLLPRILYGNLSVQEALHACEQDFAQGIETPIPVEPAKEQLLLTSGNPPELDVNEILAEVTRIFEERAD